MLQNVIKGITVQLHQHVQVGVDELNRPIYEDNVVQVDNVLVCPVESSPVMDSTSMTGKRATYELCIPKEDAHNWVDTLVEFWGETWQTVSYPIRYIDNMVPLDWNQKVRVERYG